MEADRENRKLITTFGAGSAHTPTEQTSYEEVPDTVTACKA